QLGSGQATGGAASLARGFRDALADLRQEISERGVHLLALRFDASFRRARLTQVENPHLVVLDVRQLHYSIALATAIAPHLYTRNLYTAERFGYSIASGAASASLP